MGRLVSDPLLRESEQKEPASNKIRQYREFMIIQKVAPAIKDRNRNIHIQEGYASSHIDEADPEFVAVGVTGVWNIRLMTLSPKLPDLNVLDLPFVLAFNQNSGATDMPRQWMS